MCLPSSAAGLLSLGKVEVMRPIRKNQEEIRPLKMMGCSLQVLSSRSGIVTDRPGGVSGDEDTCGGLSWVVVSERRRWKTQLKP